MTPDSVEPDTDPPPASPAAPAPAPVGARRTGRGADRRSSAVGAATEVLVVLTLALALSLLIKTFLVQAFFIPSPSMEDTLLTGDRVLVSKLTPHPFELHRGDVIVFKDPGNWLDPVPARDDSIVVRLLRDGLTFVGLIPQDSGQHLIKRVIGLPGDHVACCDDQGQVTVNGVGVHEPYIYPGDRPSDTTFNKVVPEGMLWVMGDHRSDSSDSRFHALDPFVPIGNVVGKAFVIVWPLDRLDTVSTPGQVFARVPDPSPGG